MSLHRPDGVEEALRLARETEEAKTKVSQEEQAVAADEAKLTQRKAELAALRVAAQAKREEFVRHIAQGASVPQPPPQPAASPVKPEVRQYEPPDALPNSLPANWAELGLKWRLAWLLFPEQEVNYEDFGQRIYGLGGEEARTRINGLLSDLRKDVIEHGTGKRRYRVKIARAQLIEKSGAKEGPKMPP